MTTTTTRNVGTVAKWLNHRGIGFITPDGKETEIGKDYLVHHSNIKQDSAHEGKGTGGFKTLAVGSKVEFDLTQDPKNADKMIAINVTGIGGVDCEQRTRTYGRGRNNAMGGGEGDVYSLSVSNLPEGVLWRELEDRFRPCGRVLVHGTTGQVQFRKQADALKAVERWNGVSYQGKELVVALEEPKDGAAPV